MYEHEAGDRDLGEIELQNSLRERQEVFAAKFGLTLAQFLKLTHVCRTEELVTVLELLKVKKHKTQFRARMHLHLKNWLDNDGFGKPFTSSQFGWLKPTWPITWQLPRLSY